MSGDITQKMKCWKRDGISTIIIVVFFNAYALDRSFFFPHPLNKRVVLMFFHLSS